MIQKAEQEWWISESEKLSRVNEKEK